jgi:sarcosine oxidase, subunit gamma
MAEAVIARAPPLAAQGPGWSTCAPLAAYSLRADLAAAQAALALAAADSTGPAQHPALQLSLAPCRALTSGSWAALWLGPDEQLLVGPRAEGAAVAQRLEAELGTLAHSLVDVSHRQAAIGLRGPFAAAMVNSGCPLDLGLEAAPVGFCSRTVYAKAEIVLWRRAEQDFQLQVWRSFLPYVTGLLALVAQEHHC